MKILVIEDEMKAARFLEKGLSENGFMVDVVHDGEEGLVAALSSRYDLVIVDVVLPGLSGIQILKRIRSESLVLPVVVLTARDSIQDRVTGIESGADVYLVKPYSFSEVLAYAKALTQRRSDAPAVSVKISDLEIDLQRQRIRRSGQTIDLTAKEFALIALLGRRKGQVLSRTVIAEEVWGMNFDPGTNVVDVHIRRLRAKVDDPFENKLIWTVRGSGYVMEDRAGEV